MSDPKPDRNERQQEIDDIRELLDYYETHPEVVIPRTLTVKHIVRGAADRADKKKDDR